MARDKLTNVNIIIIISIIIEAVYGSKRGTDPGNEFITYYY